MTVFIVFSQSGNYKSNNCFEKNDISISVVKYATKEPKLGTAKYGHLKNIL